MRPTRQVQAEREIAGIDLFRLRLPLSSPYHLSFGDLAAFEPILIRLRTADRCEGWGETTPLPGYSHEDVEEVWRRVTNWSRALRSASVGDALSFLDSRSRHAPFACAGLATAIESLAPPPPSGGDQIAPGDARGPAARPADAEAGTTMARIPLVGTIRSAVPSQIARDVSSLIAAGHTSLKLKVGNNAAADLANVRAAQEAMGNGGRLRIDANQGYSLEEARAFLHGLDPAGIELFEQPFPADRWDWMEALAAGATVPLMLDESIVDESDLRRARALSGVRYVKFKLMKAGSIARLRSLMDQAFSLGLGVVVGNGVAGEIGCLHEAWAVSGRLTLAGEMNGFLKPTWSLLADPLRVIRGELVVPPLHRITILRERLEGCCAGFASV